jgi:hypothetical protein
MGQVSIAVLKRVAFRGAVQEFSNTYHYGSIDSNPIFGTGKQLTDEVVAFEKSIHSNVVTFVNVKMWSSGGTIAQNEMIYEENLTGVGSQQPTPSMDRERAYLFSWKAGKNSRGKPVYLRKWFHLCGNFGGVVINAGILDNTAGFAAADRTIMEDKIDEITRIGSAAEWGMIAESGRERDAGKPICHRFLEHHQLGDQWRG